MINSYLEEEEKVDKIIFLFGAHISLSVPPAKGHDF